MHIKERLSVFLLAISLSATAVATASGPPDLTAVNKGAKVTKLEGPQIQRELQQPTWLGKQRQQIQSVPSEKQLQRAPLLSFGTLEYKPLVPGDHQLLDVPTQKAQAVNMTAANFVPLCQTLSTNTYYTLSGATAGGAYCYHFKVPVKSKTTVGLIGQSAATDFALYLFKDDGANNIDVVGASDNPGNANEVFQVLTEAGDYYWYMEANASDGSAITFVALVDGPADDYEINDTVEQAYALPDRLNVIRGNSDSASDVDYYRFTAIRGQSVRISFLGLDGVAATRWILELYNGSQWVALNAANYSDVNNLQPNQVLYVRVRANPNTAWSANAWYQLTFGSRPALSSWQVNGEWNVLRIPAGVDTAYGFMTTQAYRELNWSSSWTDSTGAPLLGVTPILFLIKQMVPGTNTYVPYSLSTGNSNSASGTVNLGTCSGDWVTEFVDYDLGYRNVWRTQYNYGQWHLKLAEALDVGVGGSNSSYVTFGHLCRQTLLSSTRT